MMGKGYRMLAAALGAALLLSGCGAAPDPAVSGGEPVKVTVWTYYNGEQLTAFNTLVSQFNDTVGREKGIVVEGASQGNVNDLAGNVLAAARGEVGAEELPSIFSAYPDTAYALDQMGGVADLSRYMTEEELSVYLDSYVDEGRFGGEGIKILPVAKSVEIMVLNRTDWEPFAAATGCTEADLSTIEGLTETAERYYDWTDGLTAEPNDGKALFGRDAMANYFLAGALQLGTELITTEDGKLTLDFDKGVVRQLWDNYYIPYIKGYFASSGRFRSDDLKTGNIIAYVGSSSSATFLPDRVSSTDTEDYPIEVGVLPCPQFAGGTPCAIQQGAGMVVTNGDEAEVRASVEFLKWLTADGQNIFFAVKSGYLPVTKSANDADVILDSGLQVSGVMEQVLRVSIDTVVNNRLYTTAPSENANAARNILEYSMADLAQADRAAVLERLAEGASLDEAAAEFSTDSYFDGWYGDALAQLRALEN